MLFIVERHPSAKLHDITQDTVVLVFVFDDLSSLGGWLAQYVDLTLFAFPILHTCPDLLAMLAECIFKNQGWNAHDLSGKPKSTPNSGYTNRVTPFWEISANEARSPSESLTMCLFSSIREGVTDLASTELPRAMW